MRRWGVEVKFSAVMEASGGLTIPAGGMGGSWIVKLPSARFAAIPENEFVMLELARRAGIAVPENRLVRAADITGLPDEARAGNEGSRRAVLRPPSGRGARPHGGFRASLRAIPEPQVQIPQLREYRGGAVGGSGRGGRRRVRPPARFLRCDRQRRHASQELVASLSRPPQARALTGLRFCGHASLHSERHARPEFRRQPQSCGNDARPDAQLRRGGKNSGKPALEDRGRDRAEDRRRLEIARTGGPPPQGPALIHPKTDSSRRHHGEVTGRV
ncbi:MAG: hypothetical protein DMG49_24220 [Acidobacteria bacterium]|nr:MAG: hypothetical protein DMG49_24220 [Acidobacteriota bacterium]